MSGFTGNYYYGVPNVNQSRISTRTLGNIQGGGFNMYNTSIILQSTGPGVPTNIQTTNTQTPTNIQTTTTQVPTNTQTTTPLIPIITQTTTPHVPVSNVTTLLNIGQMVTTSVGTTIGVT